MISTEETLAWDDQQIAETVHYEEATLLNPSVFLTLEEAGLEENMRCQPSHGYQEVQEYINWFSDREDSRYETN